MIETAVVILNYNGLDYLRQFLPVLVANTPEAHIVIVDNASTDQSLNYLRSEFEEIELIVFEKNHGFSGGYNKALQQIEAKYYILLNSDVEVTPGWMEPLLRELKSSASTAACQPKILQFHNKDQFEYAGAAGGFIDYLGYPFCRGRIFDILETDEGQYNDRVPIFWATGACLAIKSEIFHKIGGFDDDFFAHMEEIDLCWRIHRNGNQVFYVPESRVYHVGGGTLQKTNPFKTYLNFRNGLAMLYKNTTGPSLWWKLFLRLILDGVAAFKFLVFDSPKHFMAILKAHFHFYGRIGRLNQHRKNFRSMAKVTNQEIGTIYKKLIIREHFLLKKSKYSELDNSD